MITIRHLLVPALAILGTSGHAGAATDAERLFTLKIAPLLAEKCNGCHGDDPEDVKGDLDTRTRESLLAGGEEIGSTVLVPGHAADSFLMKAIRWEDADLEMPPKENDRLTKSQIAQLAAWIDAGAPWPDEETRQAIRVEERSRLVTDEGAIVTTSGGLGDEWTFRRYAPEDIWAFQPVTKPTVPEGAANPVDAFVLHRLAEAGFHPAPEADPRLLIRRATFDLTGLPPTPEETRDFLGAWATDPGAAWTTLVERLLASPRYGERWGQHWLDVARYADTGGMSNDYERSNAWRYRDYVIRAFNDDKPYDRFIMEQLAGDEIDPENPEMLVATGFLRMGPFDSAMVEKPEARQIYLDDVVNSVGQTFLSTTMRCFKCHDHKFDPLPTRDYYRLYATFSTTQMAERPAPHTAAENREGFEEGKAHVARLLSFATDHRKALDNRRETAARAWYKEHGLEYVGEKERRDLPDEMKPPRSVGLDHVAEGQLKVREQDEWIWTRRQERYEPMAQSVYNGPDPQWLDAKKLRVEPPSPKNKNWKPESHILTGGALEAPGEKVTPGVLSALGIPVEGAPSNDPYALPESVEGRRLAFAKWVADPRNPLTTRSIINRVWQHHFGKPIAGNPNNFGVKGAKPTHPELLDWLAADFVENGWTLKRLHRAILLSNTYRQAGNHPRLEELRTKDPNNDLFAYFPSRRLSAEEIRDGMLVITGELNPVMGGLPAMPEINMEVALQPRMIQFSLAPAYQPSPKPEQRNRRSIYAYRVRGQADPFLELFNLPNPNDSCENRDSAAVTPQVFSLLNSDTATDRSIALALRLERESGDVDQRIARAFQLVVNRDPSPGESERLAAYLREMADYHRTVEAKDPVYPTSITRSLVEEFSGMPFEYEEILPAFENYVPDKKAGDVGPEIRALADVCLLLFNLNEFVYVY